MLKDQKANVGIIPDITVSQLILSIPMTSGETTTVAKTPWPISREISDKVLSWELVNSSNLLDNT